MTSDPSSISAGRRAPRLTLRARGLLVLAPPMVAIFVALFALFWFEDEAASAEREAVRTYRIAAELLQLQMALPDARSVAEGDAATVEPALAAAASALQRVEAAAAGEPWTAPLRAQIERAFQAARAGSAADSATVMSSLRQRVSAMAPLLDRRLTAAQQARETARRRLLATVLLAGVAGPIGGLFLHLIISGRLVKRLDAVERNAQRLAHGVPIEPMAHADDEIGSLARQLENAAFLMRERERELRESERRYRELFDRAPVAYEETDTDGAVTRFNEEVCTLLRCTPDRVLGRLAWDFVAPGQQHSFRTAMLDRIARGAETGPLECDYLLEDGTSLRVEIRESLIRNEAGVVTGVCRSVLDVTERNLAAVAARKVAQYAMELRNKNEQLARALDAARSATEAKSRFLAAVSHELRTPLNGIIGFSELMYDGKLGPMNEEQQDVLGDILNSSRHLLQLISDILDLSKVEAGRMEFYPERCRIDRLALEVRDVVRPLADRKNLQLEAVAPEGLEGFLDPSRFKQVLYNFLSNAVKFTPPGGRISLRLNVDSGGRLCVEVEDTGIGIPAAELPLLFREFQQLPNSRRAEQGTGLGLALTKLMVEAQGGSVGVRSSPGKGSVFTAVIPMIAKQQDVS